MKVMNKLLSLLLCLILLFGLCAPAVAAQESAVIRIYTASDFITFSKQCSLDSWSRDKTVLLERNIDLSLTQFQPIPTFGGVFDGQGNTITGLNLRTNGQVQGLFRYVQQSGVIKNLTVDGTLVPSDHKTALGGIAGVNHGTITHCMFRGTIRGEHSIGGIAGINQTSGQILNCSFTGTITGEHYVGGITGQNLGGIVQCRSSGSINITEVKATLNPENLDLEDLNSTANLPATTDIGGIAGFSSGTIQSCHNTGDVGYPHVGYNIGGIVGRHNGYLDSCTNSGHIQGRKDVGGIAGQMEPQLTLKYDRTALDQLWTELDTLEALIDGFLEDTSGAADRLTGEIQGVSDSAAGMKDAVADLSSAMTQWADDSVAQINDASARISWVLERMVPVVDTVEGSLDLLEQTADELSEALSLTGAASRYGAQAADEMALAMNDIRHSAAIANAAVSRLRQAMALLTQSLYDRAKAMEDMTRATEALTDALAGISAGLTRLFDAMGQAREEVWNNPGWEQLRGGVAELRDALDLLTDALLDIAAILKNAEEDETTAEGLELFASAGEKLTNAAAHMSDAWGQLLSAYQVFQENDSAQTARDHLEQAMEDLRKAQQETESAAADLAAGVEDLKDSDTAAALQDKLDGLEQILPDIRDAMAAIGTALEQLAQFDLPEQELEEMRSAAEAIMESVDDMGLAAKQLGDAFGRLTAETDPAVYQQALEEAKLAVQLIQSAAVSMTNAVRHMENAMKLLSSTVNGLAAALDAFAKTGATLADCIGQLELAVGSSGSILAELAALPPIQFDLPGDHIGDEGIALSAAADSFFTSFNDLNSTLRGQANLLTDDLQAVNAQLGVIADLLRRFQQEQTAKDTEGLLEDVSAQAADDSMSSGKISSCENLGTVEGDLNVAGIVGSVAIEYDFDPEDDLTVSGSRSIDMAFLTRGVVHGCINRGAVTAKKNAVGGIVGLMDLGYLSACQSYGTVTSTAGKYVGGIAGQSYGGIADCWAKCALSGSSYVGGIAGFGSLIQNCRTLIDAPSGVPFSGAVAGQAEEIGALTGNLFVHHALAGVDGVSYDGGAQPIPYEQFITLDGMPDEFAEFSLTFTADGKTVAVIPFQYGDSLTQLPEIPEKAAHSSRWPELDYSFLFFSRTVEAQYTPYDTALSDGQALPTYLVDGSFSPDAQISVSQSEVDWVDEQDNVCQIPVHTVTVTDPNTEQITYTLHWRLPEDGEYDLWVLKGAGWVRQSYTPDGSYLVLACSGEQITFCLTPQAKPPLLLFGLILLAVVVLAIVIISLIRRSNRKKKQLVALITGE